MAKLYFIIAIAAVICGEMCQGAQRTRLVRLTQQRSRYLGRQATAEDVVTPYPSADELKPEIPFDEADEPAAYVPDSVYGPPIDTTYNVPDEVYGPPEVNENELPIADPAVEVFPAPLDGEQARLLASRRANLRRRQAAAVRAQRLAKLRAPIRRSA